MTAASALIFGCAGVSFSSDERAFFAGTCPWGLILFKRNIESKAQLAELTGEFRSIVGRVDAPVLIDQEGGRVQRLGPPIWPKHPAAKRYSAINDSFRRRDAVRLGARLMAQELAEVGINVDCLPVLDVPVAGADAVIGDRAYGMDVDAVALSGRAAAEGLLAGCVLPVVKHIPGHGRAGVDSHLDLPRVRASLDELKAHDFAPFRFLTDMPLAMTAHVVFEAIDRRRPATQSRRVFNEIIRGHIGFHGLVMSDDLSMKALRGGFAERVKLAYSAGCDVILHCNGDPIEMREVATAARPLAGRASRRAEAALARIKHVPEPFDPVEGRAALEAFLAGTS